LRHPTSEERLQIKELVEKIGPVEVLRVIAGLVAQTPTEVATLDEVDFYRGRLMRVARELDSHGSTTLMAPSDERRGSTDPAR
jgi:hypothetical protein